jgi:hypothetical protein
MKEQILRKMIRESVKRMISKSTLKEAITANKSITTQQATKIADKFAKYMSSKENKKFTVTKGSVEGPSFDLNVDGFKYEGGSYIIDTKGDIINVAISKPEVYGNISMLESTLKEYGDYHYRGDSSLEELADMLGYSHVMEFFEDNSGAVDAVYKWVESIPSFKQKMKQSGMYESSLKEADMTRQYDGFIVQDRKTLKNYKFRYIKGANSVKVEDAAIAKVMDATKGPRAQFWVNGSIKKGQWNYTDVDESKQDNAMKTKIREAGGRRFAKTESIRQHTASKIKEANKKK